MAAPKRTSKKSDGDLVTCLEAHRKRIGAGFAVCMLLLVLAAFFLASGEHLVYVFGARGLDAVRGAIDRRLIFAP